MSRTKEKVLFFNKLKIIDKYGLDLREELYSVPIKYIEQMLIRTFQHVQYPTSSINLFTGETEYTGAYSLQNKHPDFQDILFYWNEAYGLLKDANSPVDEFDDNFVREALSLFDMEHPDPIMKEIKPLGLGGKFLEEMPQDWLKVNYNYYRPNPFTSSSGIGPGYTFF
jgi:hypothetical protein